MAYNAYIKVNPEAVSPAIFADAKPLVCSTPGGLVFDLRTPEVMYYVCPTLGDVYAYSQTVSNAREALRIRYPEGRRCTGEDVRAEYSSFLLGQIASAPQPLYVDATQDDVPSAYSGAKREAYQQALEEYDGDQETMSLYHVFAKQETMVGQYKAPRAITAHSKECNIQMWPFIHAFERTLLSINDIDGERFFAKGLSFDKRAAIVMRKARDRVVFSLDMSSFDNSIRGGFFAGELDVFASLFGVNFDRSWYDEAWSVLSRDGTERRPTEKCRRSGDL